MRFAPRTAIVVSVFTLVTSMLGFVAAIVLNTFVLDEYDAYGEVAIPGSGSLHLPAGEVTISFRTVITGRPSGGGLPVPDLQMSIEPPEGVPDPTVTESFGATTTINSDARVRVWVAQVSQEATYDIVTDGNVDGYISPRLAFGRDGSHDWVPWLFGGLFVVGLLGLAASLMWAARARKAAKPLEPQELSPPATEAASYAPNDEGIRLEQIRQLAALRDSGALTEEEYTAEKRRILDWGPS
jgi:Short C-terminal domain